MARAKGSAAPPAPPKRAARGAKAAPPPAARPAEVVWLYECKNLGSRTFVIQELTTNQLVRGANNLTLHFDNMEAAVKHAEKLAGDADFSALVAGVPWRTYDKKAPFIW